MPHKGRQEFFCYLPITNIPYRYRAKRSNICNIFIFNRNKLNASGLTLCDVVDHQLAPDLVRLTTQGITVKIAKLMHNVPVTLHSFVGDNLGVGEMLGLSDRYLVNQFICRFCGLPVVGKVI